MNKTGLKEVHKDDDYLMTGAHDAGNSSTLRDIGADFKSCSVMTGLFIENETQASSGYVKTVTENEIVADGIRTHFVTSEQEWTTEQGVEWEDALLSWSKDDVYKIYKSSMKGSVISADWVDRSRGWKTDPEDLERGWRKSDIDLDWDGRKIFSPGQPEKGK